MNSDETVKVLHLNRVEQHDRSLRRRTNGCAPRTHRFSLITHHLSPITCFHRSAFSLAELMIAIVILGIGLLITSSMFPIAWYKARDVAESAVLPALANSAELTVANQCRASAPPANVNAPTYNSSFLLGDWLPAIAFRPLEMPAVVYPDTRVHPLNLGNYLARSGEDFREEGTEWIPVSDDGWSLEDNLDLVFGGTPEGSYFLGESELMRQLKVRAHVRLGLPLEARPLEKDDPEPQAVALWTEKFELRRHCWAVFYKFEQLSGLDYANFQSGLFTPNQLQALTAQGLKQPRKLTLYCFTLKRPVGARYARQLGYDPEDSSSQPIDPAAPEAMPNTPEVTDLLLPVPWRFAATLVTLPSAGVPGVPSEIFIPYKSGTGGRNLMTDVLDVGFVLLDDRTGQVMKITNRQVDAKPPGQSEAGVILTLDRDYTVAEIENVPEYEPKVADLSLSNPQKARYNWEKAGDWFASGCDKNPTQAVCNLFRENEPERRFYWVFLPPVDPERGQNNTPLFDGSQPVVGVEIRQMTL